MKFVVWDEPEKGLFFKIGNVNANGMGNLCLELG